jgi:hypothetical protein
MNSKYSQGLVIFSRQSRNGPKKRQEVKNGETHERTGRVKPNNQRGDLKMKRQSRNSEIDGKKSKWKRECGEKAITREEILKNV